MTDYTLYHNPRCSKSRATLELLESKGIKPTIILYLDNPPSKELLQKLLSQLNMSTNELLRTKEEDYRTLQLADKSLTEDDLIQIMVDHPKLIERPIFVAGDKAVVGRPPENVLTLI